MPYAVNKKGFTLVELIVVVAILGILGGAIYTVFITNWFNYQDRITRAEMWREANQVIEMMTDHGRVAASVDITEDAQSTFKSVDFFDDQGQTLATYEMNAAGEFQQKFSDGNVSILSGRLNFVKSSFQKEGAKTLSIILSLQELNFTRMINVETSTEIYLRN